MYSRDCYCAPNVFTSFSPEAMSTCRVACADADNIACGGATTPIVYTVDPGGIFPDLAARLAIPPPDYECERRGKHYNHRYLDDEHNNKHHDYRCLHNEHNYNRRVHNEYNDKHHDHRCLDDEHDNKHHDYRCLHNEHNYNRRVHNEYNDKHHDHRCLDDEHDNKYHDHRYFYNEHHDYRYFHNEHRDNVHYHPDDDDHHQYAHDNRHYHDDDEQDDNKPGCDSFGGNEPFTGGGFGPGPAANVQRDTVNSSGSEGEDTAEVEEEIVQVNTFEYYGTDGDTDGNAQTPIPDVARLRTDANSTAEGGEDGKKEEEEEEEEGLAPCSGIGCTLALPDNLLRLPATVPPDMACSIVVESWIAGATTVLGHMDEEGDALARGGDFARFAKRSAIQVEVEVEEIEVVQIERRPH
ncbi:hypothetical protein MMYC01_208368 [Madurella mycetomatis]|uniref:WSC domain-containing protein n=1 Tax=Madurella mycetomatis TaxID=100816 RepID=A0A175VSK9_9PEZI|nr:hypothetical protein MMYC01_208368 [Madurella mycetomatis]